MFCINFSDKMNECHARDIITFVGALDHLPALDNDIRRLMVNFFTMKDDLSPTMCTCTIRFQFWKRGEYGYGTICECIIYRAKTFDCHNVIFRTFTSNEINEMAKAEEVVQTIS